MATRDIIVIGSSMGGVAALKRLVAELPADLPATVCIVQHTASQAAGMLADILNHRSALQIVTGDDGMKLEHGRIYIAPPDRHMILTSEGIRTTFGPRENRSRPAIDPLFRTAAANHRGRVIGVVLTGFLGDGTAGLYAVEKCGGLPIVQDPQDAEVPDMPANALIAVPTAERVSMSQLAATLDARCRETAPSPPEVPDVIRLESIFTERAMAGTDWRQVPGGNTDFTCPECRGAMHQIADGGIPRYRCRVGHAYSSVDLLHEKARSVEESIWVATQTLEERASMLEKMAARHGNLAGMDSELAGRAAEARIHAAALRQLLNNLMT